MDEARERERAAEDLRNALGKDKHLLEERLWDCIKAYQGYTFMTVGRGNEKRGAVEFSYVLKMSRRTGQYNDEIIISRKENSKSLTRSSVEIALENALQEQREFGCVSGPKKLKVFGASYLYPMFLAWGIITKNDERVSQICFDLEK